LNPFAAAKKLATNDGEARIPPQMPDAWRGFLERFNQGGLEQPGIAVGWQAVSRDAAERRSPAGTVEHTWRIVQAAAVQQPSPAGAAAAAPPVDRTNRRGQPRKARAATAR